jgi:hypothetical protein
LDLQFADLDADGNDELVLLAADDLIIIDGDLQVTQLGPFAPVGDQLTALRANDDEHLDLLVSNSETGPGELWIGSGGFELAQLPGGPASPVRHPTAIDWPSGGRQELLAISSDQSQTLVISMLELSEPLVESFPSIANSLDEVGVGQLIEDGDSIVTSESCAVVVHSPSGAQTVLSDPLPGEPCQLVVAQLDGTGTDEVLSVQSVGDHSELYLLSEFGPLDFNKIPGVYLDVVALDLDGDSTNEVLLISDKVPKMFRFNAGKL